MVPLSKSGVRKHRGFESRPLRHSLTHRTRQSFVAGSAHSLTHPRVRSLVCSPAPRPDTPGGRVGSTRERSPSGLWRRTGNAVRGNPSRVRIPPSPPRLRAAAGQRPPLRRTRRTERQGARAQERQGARAQISGAPTRHNSRRSGRRMARAATSGAPNLDDGCTDVARVRLLGARPCGARGRAGHAPDLSDQR